MGENYETLLYEERDGVAYATLNRPDVHNVFNQDSIAQGQRMFASGKRIEWRFR
jgi:enoyl-CoA hydratase/carnithine racemase